MKDVVTGARARHVVLVTGFGAFPGAARNPTPGMLRHLERHRPRFARLGIDVVCHVLPVTFAGVGPALDAAVARFKPDSILHLGLATRRKAISVETRALNRIGLKPDASGTLPGSRRLRASGPAALRATYPSAAILAALRRLGLPATLSIDAGPYVCNAALYHSLATQAAARIGFIHVPKPRPGTRPDDSAEERGVSPSDLSRAAVAAVLATAGARAGPRRPRAAITSPLPPASA